MAVHYSTRNCGAPDTNHKEKECQCLMNINGVCHRATMQNMAEAMIKDGNDDYVMDCLYHEGYLMVSEFRVKSKLI